MSNGLKFIVIVNSLASVPIRYK